MRRIAIIGTMAIVGGCSGATPLSLTPQKEVLLKRDYNSAADCFYRRMSAQSPAAISKAEMPSQRASEVKMQLDAIPRWTAVFSDTGKGTTKVTISTMETVWATSAPSAAADLAQQVDACG